ncbi:hypothetical protein DRW03_05290 [Corallococcus sp. H22C18031201]|uniref:outer membrane beta-barrel protein n=1 Tax=Citreicoccus inhibens TaxID=2849499 RepID=UPI000E764AFF|nr:outer membrane beta-barrel protein [Citreicoccus inhibens]MBU8896010.1 porin family protein [Citreicoccus inhibens]RJS25885.1 hypothetical protein DRW03_05290 [Corallococcus sp. H22C18031201]
MEWHAVARRFLVAGTCAMASPALAADATQVAKAFDFHARHVEVGFDVRMGIGSFTGDLGKRTDVGPTFGINALAQPWSLVGVELGYEGQRLPIDDSRVPADASLWRHNGTLLGKFGPLLKRNWRPFIGAGFGVSYLNPSDDTRGVYSTDVQTEFPLAAGVDYRVGHIFAGVRATYRFIGGEGLTLIPGTQQESRGGLFNGNLAVGGHF